MTTAQHMDLRTIAQPADWHGLDCQWGCGDRETRGADGEYRYADPNPIVTNVMVVGPEGEIDVRHSCAAADCLERATSHDTYGDVDPIVELSSYRDDTVLGDALAVILPGLSIEPERLAYAAMHLPPVLRQCTVALIDSPPWSERQRCHRCSCTGQMIAERAGGALCGHCAPDVLVEALTKSTVAVEVYV